MPRLATKETRDAYLRGPDMDRHNLPRTTRYRRVGQGLLTPPVRLGAQASGWPRHEIEVIEAARAAGVNDEQLRALVTRLMQRRREQFERLAEASGLKAADYAKPMKAA